MVAIDLDPKGGFMASGKSHDTAAIVIAVWLICIAGGVVRWSHPQFWFWVSASAGALSGLFLSPDLDLNPSRPRRRWGLLGFIWKPYQLIKHRHWLSHLPVASTLIRVAYLAIPLTLAMRLVNIVFLANSFDLYLEITLPVGYFASWVAGLALSDLAHWLMDGCPMKF